MSSSRQRGRVDSNEIPMVDAQDADEETTEYNAVDADAAESDSDADQYYDQQEEDGEDVGQIKGMNPRHWMRLLRT